MYVVKDAGEMGKDKDCRDFIKATSLWPDDWEHVLIAMLLGPWQGNFPAAVVFQQDNSHCAYC